MRARDPAKEKAIRERALEMIVKTGFDGLSMQKLARAAHVSPATIYIYFRDRDDLILRLHEEISARMAEVTLRNFDPNMSFEDGLRVQWINRARYCLEHSKESHFLEQLRHSPLHQRAERTMKAPFVEAMRTFVGNAIRRGELVRIPVEVYWSIAFAPLYQLVKFHMHGGLPGTGPFVLDEKALSQTLSLVIKALKP
jgi:AcrR family transcriptional regulator